MSIENPQTNTPSDEGVIEYIDEIISFQFDPDRPGAKFTEVVLNMDWIENQQMFDNQSRWEFQANKQFDGDLLEDDSLTLIWEPDEQEYQIKFVNKYAEGDRYAEMIINFSKNGNDYTKSELLRMGIGTDEVQDDTFEVSSLISTDGKIEIRSDCFNYNEYASKLRDNNSIPILAYHAGPHKFNYVRYDNGTDVEDDDTYVYRGDKKIDSQTATQSISSHLESEQNYCEESIESALPDNLVDILISNPVLINSAEIGWNSLGKGILNGQFEIWDVLKKIDGSQIVDKHATPSIGNLSFIELGKEIEKAYPPVTFKY